MFVKSFDIGHGLVQPARRDQVRLLYVVEQKVFLPVFVLEALVTFGGLDDGRRRLPKQFHHRRLPKRRVVPHQVQLRFSHAIRVGQHFCGELEECFGQAELVRRERSSGPRMTRHELAEQLGALVGSAGVGRGECNGIAGDLFGARGRIACGHCLLPPVTIALARWK